MAGKVQVDLGRYIDKHGTYGQNIADGCSISNVLEGDHRLLVRSDADDQLLLTFAFTEKVKLTGLAVGAPADATRPMAVKLFVNQPAIDFSDAESLIPAAEIKLSKDDVTTPAVLPLKVVKFTGVDNVTLLVVGSEGGDISAVHTVKFYGEAMQG
jgi:hypothetical protein